MKKSLTIFLLAIALISCKKDEIKIIGTTEKFNMSSLILQDDYEIFVYLPPNLKIESNQLIIGLDADFSFYDIASIISDMSENGTIPPCIFVGIGNSKNRNRDYTPTAFKHGKGGAQNFYMFITDELIPALTNKYDISSTNSKTLLGNSFGGLFTQFAMFQDKDQNPFDKYISVGCSYWFDSGVIFEYEQEYAKKYTNLPVKFFNGMGTLEGGISLASFEEMNERLNSRGYPDFESEAFLIKNHGHAGAQLIGFKKGLEYVFNR